MYRQLTENEINYVSGSGPNDDWVVIARPHAESAPSGGGSYYFSMAINGPSFFTQLFEGSATISVDVPMPTSTEGNIIVEATKEQVQAAKDAYAMANFDVDMLTVLAGVAGGLFGKYTASALGGVGAYIGINEEELKDSLQSYYYHLDGADGSYDGFRGQPTWYNNGGGIGGSGTPPKHEP